MVRIVKKASVSKKKETRMRIAAVIFALIAAAIIMALLGYNPFDIYAKMIEGSLMSGYRLKETLNKAIPLAILSLGIAVAFQMKFWNIGAEGQFYMGAFGASVIAFSFPDLPMPILLILMGACSVLFGGLWAMIPAVLKTKFSTSETLVTLMLNYIATIWISYLQYGPWKDPEALGFPKIAPFSDNAVLPSLFGVHIGWIITLVLAVFVFFLIKKSKLGYEISVLGESEMTAKYAGMNVFKVVVIAIFISGGICGIAGMVQASAIEKSLSDQLSGGLGFTAVITTWLAKLSAPMILVVSFLFAMLLQGGAFLQSALKIPSSVGSVLQAVIIFFVLGSEFFLRYKIVWGQELQEKEEK